MRFLLFSLFTVFTHWNLNSQSEYLADLNIFLIGPENVNLHFQEQEAFYLAEYRQILKDSKEELSVLLAEKTALNDKKWLRKKGKQRLAEVNYLEVVIKAEISSLKKYIELWERYPFHENPASVAQQLLTDDCLELVGEKGVFSPKEYQVVTITNDFYVSWEEVIKVPVIEKEVVTNKWVKQKADRNCLSANPNDCLVWVLVEEIEKKTIKTCPTDFPKRTARNLCIRELSIENKHFMEKRIKAFTTKSRFEIELVEVRKINCE